MLSASLDQIANLTVLAGAPLHIALGGHSDVQDAVLTYEISSTNDDLETFVPEGNRSLRISVAGYDQDMVFELFEGRVPAVTSRIIALATGEANGGVPFYDGLIFHRVIKDFMIQGGDPLGTGTGGSGVDFDDQFHLDLQHTSAGVLSMAKSSDDTNDSQFFITSVPTRHLDFNHSIFGILTDGDEVREALENVAITDDGSNKPLADVVMDSVSVFVDNENGVLMLSAPEGTTGTAVVTVTADDGSGQTATQTFNVTIVADTANGKPYVGPIDQIETTADTPVTFTIPGVDVEGDVINYGAEIRPANADLAMVIDNSTGVVTITPSNGLVGVHSITVGVWPQSGDPTNEGDWDIQDVPVLISPAPPTAIELLTSADTGASSTDRITNLNNSEGNTLRFRVSGVVDGAEVQLFADGQLIAQGIASGDSIVLNTNGTVELADGVHSITAVQTLRDQEVNVGNRDDTVDLLSEVSDPLEVTIDTVAPTITTDAVTDAGEGKPYLYDVETNEEADGGVSYRLVTSPAGMVIDLLAGEVAWTPSDGQGGTHSVAIRATDLAGNFADQLFDVVVEEAPELQPIADQEVTEGTLLTFTAGATDPDGPLVWGLEGAPAGAAIDPDSGVFTWTPGEEQGPGVYRMTITVTDATGAASRDVFDVTVLELNQPPVLEEIDDRWIDEGQLLDLAVTATDDDRPENN